MGAKTCNLYDASNASKRHGQRACRPSWYHPFRDRWANCYVVNSNIYSYPIQCYEDEAHRGTGDYAYCQVMRYLMAKNPHFRVLALTATPGNSPEAVQRIVDSLHISQIEIRNEQSFDLQRYLFKKVSAQILCFVLILNEVFLRKLMFVL